MSSQWSVLALVYNNFDTDNKNKSFELKYVKELVKECDFGRKEAE